MGVMCKLMPANCKVKTLLTVDMIRQISAWLPCDSMPPDFIFTKRNLTAADYSCTTCSNLTGDHLGTQ